MITLLILISIGIQPLFAFSATNDLCKRIDPVLRQNLQVIGIPAISFSAILPNGKQITCAEGISNLATQKHVTVKDLFQIGSATKTFIATLVLLDIKAGKLKLNETIAQTIKRYGHWLPVLAEKRWGAITIKQLLNMTSGIYSYTDSPEFNKLWEANPTMQWSPKQIIKIALSQPSYFKPGHGWHYSDTNYYLLGVLLTKIMNKSLAQQIQDQFWSCAGRSF